jgi:Retinal pigment epithelial membrane protein
VKRAEKHLHLVNDHYRFFTRARGTIRLSPYLESGTEPKHAAVVLLFLLSTRCGTSILYGVVRTQTHPRGKSHKSERIGNFTNAQDMMWTSASTGFFARSQLLLALAWTTSSFIPLSNVPHRSPFAATELIAPALSAASRTADLTTDSRSPSVTRQPMPWTMNKDYGEFNQDDWAWAYSSVPKEAIGMYECTNIEGSLPKDLRGVFYRIGPGRKTIPTRVGWGRFCCLV